MKSISSLSFISALLLAGCANDRAMVLSSGAPQQLSVSRGTTAQNLIWSIDGYVYGYTYSGQLAQELTGFSDPAGLCTDPSGDLYVVDAGRDEVFAYAPGQSLPFYIYDDFGQQPNSCAFDPTTGNLAVTNQDNLTIFPPASGTPLTYTTPQMISYFDDDYDKSGNLYIDGARLEGDRGLAIAELPAGAKTITDIKISLTKEKPHRPGGIMWDGHDVVVADFPNRVLYRVAISGSTGTILDTWHLSHWTRSYPPEFVVTGKTLIFPHFGEVEFFSYPPKGRAKNGFFGNIGGYLTVSPEVTN